MISIILFFFTFCTTAYLAIRNGATYIFVLYQAYYFFNPETKWWAGLIPDLRYSFYIVLILLFVVTLNWSKLKQNKILKVPQFRYLYLTAFLYLIASIYAVLPQVHSIALDAILTVSVLVTLVYKLIDTEKKLHIAILGYVVFASYMGYYVSQFGRVSNGRFEGGGMVDSPDANGIGAALAPALIFSLFYVWKVANWKYKLIFSVFCIYLANALVQIGSRGAFLGALAGAGVFLVVLFFAKARKPKQRLQVLLLVAAGLIGTFIVTDQAFWERMQTIKTQNIETAAVKESGSTRVFFWLAAYEMSKDYPFGAGASGFVYFSNFYIPQSIDTGASRNRAVHSTWLEVLTEIGYPGLLSFCLMIYYSFKTIRESIKITVKNGNIDGFYTTVAIGCALLCFVVSMTFLNRFRAEILYWLILYSAVAYNVFVLKATKTNQGT